MTRKRYGVWEEMELSKGASGFLGFINGVTHIFSSFDEAKAVSTYMAERFPANRYSIKEIS